MAESFGLRSVAILRADKLNASSIARKRDALFKFYKLL
jgi:hypothetical protein